jgi:hypothetical protein
MHCDVTNESTYELVKPLYNSFFSKNKVLKNRKERFNQLNQLKQTVKPEESGIEEDSKSIDKSLAKSKPNLKLKTNTKKEATSSNEQNNQEPTNFSQSKHKNIMYYNHY